MRQSIARMLLLTVSVLALSGAVAARPPATVGRMPGVGRTQTVEGFAVKLRWIERAHEAGAADYVAGRGNVFLLVAVAISRAGSHGSYYADPQDFHIQTSSGDVIDSEQFGMQQELHARHVYSHAVTGVIGFEVPAKDRNLRLLWQPAFSANPDAQAQWAIGSSGRTVQYYQ